MVAREILFLCYGILKEKSSFISEGIRSDINIVLISQASSAPQLFPPRATAVQRSRSFDHYIGILLGRVAPISRLIAKPVQRVCCARMQPLCVHNRTASKLHCTFTFFQIYICSARTCRFDYY